MYFKFPYVDDISKGLITIDFEHHEIHEGNFFRGFFVQDTPNATSLIVKIQTPNSQKKIHLRPLIIVEQEATIIIYENPTSAIGGTPQTPQNANRNSLTLSTVLLSQNPVVNLVGAVQLMNIRIGSGGGTGGSFEALNETVLKLNTTYLVHVTNNNAGNSLLNVLLGWYEN